MLDKSEIRKLEWNTDSLKGINTRQKILIAGATGYFGKFSVKTFKHQGYYVRALARGEKNSLRLVRS